MTYWQLVWNASYESTAKALVCLLAAVILSVSPGFRRLTALPFRRLYATGIPHGPGTIRMLPFAFAAFYFARSIVGAVRLAGILARHHLGGGLILVAASEFALLLVCAFIVIQAFLHHPRRTLPRALRSGSWPIFRIGQGYGTKTVLLVNGSLRKGRFSTFLNDTAFSAYNGIGTFAMAFRDRSLPYRASFLINWIEFEGMFDAKTASGAIIDTFYSLNHKLKQSLHLPIVFESIDIDHVSAREGLSRDEAAGKMGVLSSRVILLVHADVRDEDIAAFLAAKAGRNASRASILVLDRAAWSACLARHPALGQCEIEDHSQEGLTRLGLARWIKERMLALSREWFDRADDTMGKAVAAGILGAKSGTLDWAVEQAMRQGHSDEEIAGYLARLDSKETDEPAPARRPNRHRDEAVRVLRYAYRQMSAESGESPSALRVDASAMHRNPYAAYSSLDRIRDAALSPMARAFLEPGGVAARAYAAFNLIEAVARLFVYRSILEAKEIGAVTEPYYRKTRGTESAAADLGSCVTWLNRRGFPAELATLDCGENFVLASLYLDKLVAGARLPESQLFPDLLAYASWLRNRLKGHGTISPVMGLLTLDLIGSLAEACVGAVLQSETSVIMSGDRAVLKAGEKNLDAFPYLRPDSEGSPLFLVGERKGKMAYLDYTSGKRVRPVLLEYPVAWMETID